MTGEEDDARGRHSGRPWLVAGVVLAAGATLALVFTEELRWLRLGIIAALWAALIGAFFAARYRKQVADTEESVAQAQEVYELELEREIAARREFELEVEAEARQRAEEESREELEALRNEVTALRESLQALFGGEVLYERVALTAQSTRMRSLSEEPRIVTAGESNGNGNGNGNGKKPAQLVAGTKTVEVSERPTELLDRVRDGDRPAPASAGQPKTKIVPRPARPADPPTRQVRPGNTGSAAARASEATRRARAEMSRPAQPPVAEPPAQSPPTRQVRPVEADFRKPDPPPSRPDRSRPPNPVPEPTRPALEPTSRGRPASSITPPPRVPDPDRPRQEPERSPVHFPEPEQPPAAAHYEPEPDIGGRRRAPEPAEPAAPPETAAAAEPRPEPNPTLPPQIRDLPARPGGRRRKPEPDESDVTPPSGAAEQVAPPGGRRRRPDDEQPWQNALGEGAKNGAGRRRAPEPEAESNGSHSEGRSVSELLAAHGASGSTPRRRRRAED